MNAAIQAAYQRVDDAESERDKLISETYLPNDAISYTHGRHEVPGTVIRTAQDRVLIEGRTGSQYWIGAYRISS